MITTGIIKRINVDDGTGKANKCEVEIQYFKTPIDTNPAPYTFQANICNPGGMYSSYQVGDLVYIGFVDNDYSLPVILGHIYQGLSGNCRSFANLDALKVSGNITLSKDIKIGDLTYAQLAPKKLYRYDHSGYIANEDESIKIYYSTLYEEILPLPDTDKQAKKILTIMDLKDIFAYSFTHRNQKSNFIGINEVSNPQITIISTQFIKKETEKDITVWYFDTDDMTTIKQMHVTDDDWHVADTLTINKFSVESVE